ncbi:MAG: Ldh family oxidoreductase [Synergistaceae bacterium]|nr:Ldh family oxidoreductase [Synergistaceae bacterium]
MTRIAYQELFDAAVEILRACGESEDNAAITAASICRADARGITTHGSYLLTPIWKRVKAGQLTLPTQAKIETDSGAVAVIDGGDGLGAVAGELALRTAIKKAKEYGVSAALIKNTNNIGFLACYTEEAAKEGMIAIMGCNAAPAMAPWGSAEAFLGTNPIAIASYTGNDRIFSADMASSVVARGKIRKAARNGEKIPDNWATDGEGNFTTDPNAALKGALLPMGGPKGSAIALAVDIISGILSGASYAPDLKSFHEPEGRTGVGASLIVLNVSAFQSPEAFAEKMGAYTVSVKNLKKAKGFDEILMPGEIELNRERENIESGIPLDDNAVAAINELLNSIGSDRILTKE